MKADEQWLSNSYDYNRFATVGIIFVCNPGRIKVVEHIIRDFQYQAIMRIAWYWKSFCFDLNYGLCPIPPSSVRVSPVMYLKSGFASCTHTRPISSSESP